MWYNSTEHGTEHGTEYGTEHGVCVAAGQLCRGSVSNEVDQASAQQGNSTGQVAGTARRSSLCPHAAVEFV